MPHKKADASQPDHEQKALVHKIDELLSLEPVAPLEAPAETPKAVPEKPKPVITEAVVPADASEPIDIFKGVADIPAVVVEAPEPPSEPDNASVLTKPELPAETVDSATQSRATIDLDDSEVNKAVDDILIKDGDALLAAEDAIATTEPHAPPHTTSQGFIKKLFK
jgi:hypothetical protein